MKRIFLFTITLLFIVHNLSAQNRDYVYTAVPFTNLMPTDNFWLPGIKSNLTVTIPASFERCATKREANLDSYYAWANKGKGEMTAWFPDKIKDI